MNSSCLQLAKDLLFPRRCPFCNAVIGFREECEKCLQKKAEWRHTPARLSPDEHRLEHLEGAASLYLYKGEVAKAILRMKFEDQPWLAREFAYEIGSQLLSCTFSVHHGIISLQKSSQMLHAYDCLVAVPSSHTDRIYNCAAMIAQILSQALEIPFYPSGIIKKRETIPQSRLGADQRLTNVVGSMVVPKAQEIEGKRVLLIDDVVTTGATISEAARALEEAGAYSIFALSIAASELDKT